MSIAPQDEIAEALQYGRITPDEAEEKLKGLGLPSLAPQPDPAEHDPMSEVWWTLPMTVAWIAWRNTADVREAWDRFRREGSYWTHEPWQLGFGGEVVEGWHLRPRPLASISLLKIKEIRRRREDELPKGACTVSQAMALLWKATEAGALIGTGKITAFDPPMEIPEHEWRDLAAVEERERDVLRFREGFGFSNRGYGSIAFRRVDVMAIWQRDRDWERVTILPPTMSPHAPGLMPLYCAAQWIATRGGTRDFSPMHITIWHGAFRELLARVASEQVTVTGLRNGARERLDGYLFASIAIDYPFAAPPFDLIVCDELHLQSFAYTDEEHWRDGYDDCLRDRAGVRWSQLMVPRAQIARWWPFDGRESPTMIRQGRGRPSKMTHIFAEYERRRKCGELEDRIGRIAKTLEGWSSSTYPERETPTAFVIANELRRKRYWPLK